MPCSPFHSADKGEAEVQVPSILLAAGDAIVIAVKPSDLNSGEALLQIGCANRGK